MFDNPKVDVELSDQASRISTRGRADLMTFRTGWHRRHVGEAMEEAEIGMGGGQERDTKIGDIWAFDPSTAAQCHDGGPEPFLVKSTTSSHAQLAARPEFSPRLQMRTQLDGPEQ
jgi:hypothetical protein